MKEDMKFGLFYWNDVCGKWIQVGNWFDTYLSCKWVFDIVYKSVFYIIEISKNKRIKTATFGWVGEFEKGRFFPVTKALYKRGV